jgi:hypothetical protein
MVLRPRTRPTSAIRTAALALLGACALDLECAHADVWQFLFGLNGENTAYDYLSAPISRAVEFEMTMCNGGVCLNETDWRCGFTNNVDLTKVQACFDDLVRKTPLWVKLDRIRKFCGVSLAQFDGIKDGLANSERCAKAGGVWGVRSRVSLPDAPR